MNIKVAAFTVSEQSINTRVGLSLPIATDYTVSIHCAPEMSEIDCIGRIESFWPKFVRGW